MGVQEGRARLQLQRQRGLIQLLDTPALIVPFRPSTGAFHSLPWLGGLGISRPAFFQRGKEILVSSARGFAFSRLLLRSLRHFGFRAIRAFLCPERCSPSGR